MAENFGAEVCGGSWAWPWDASRGIFNSSPCCSSIVNDMGGFGWPNPELLDSKPRSSDESGSISDGRPILIQDMPQIMPTQRSSSIDSSLQMMGVGLSSSVTTDWNQALINGSSDQDLKYSIVQQEDQNSSMNYRQETGVDLPQEIQKNWSGNNFESSSIKSFEFMNHDLLSLDQKPINSLSKPPQNTSPSQSLSGNFPVSSVLYGYPSTLLQTLFETEPQAQQSFYDTRLMNACPSTTNYQTNKKPTNLLQLSADTNSCSASEVALNDFPVAPFTPPPQFFTAAPIHGKRPSLPNFKATINNEDVRGVGKVAKKSGYEPTFKRPRIETPTPLPTFKVRKEKLGDRITALQQLVSPFGKTDTASVLHEAIDYIKLLHDQLTALSTPYLKNGARIQHLHNSDKAKEQGPTQDLKSRGLCLVPISSTFPVAAATTTDLWIPTFGGTFK